MVIDRAGVKLMLAIGAAPVIRFNHGHRNQATAVIAQLYPPVLFVIPTLLVIPGEHGQQAAHPVC
ncbi:hypothetical protein SBA4_1900022 [Candidatus Sulfopaludibacter sp. SbA4]|nr:hypothetical protein SBA4_1900022 [Candidatus Sulfopaludibacter sp. SbA4]